MAADPGAAGISAQLLALLGPYYQVAKTKRAFDFSATAICNPVPFTEGRIAALIIPAGNVWLGGDGGLSTNNGLPIGSGGFVSFGPEEGNSITWLITTALLAPIDVRCFELLLV
jgi:hypothetical protein